MGGSKRQLWISPACSVQHEGFWQLGRRILADMPNTRLQLCFGAMADLPDLIRKHRSRPGLFCVIVRNGEKTNPAWDTWRFVFTVDELLDKFTAMDKPLSIAGLT